MSVYRLEVRAEGKRLSQGTVWLLRPDLAVTAFHVVGKTSVRAWWHEAPGTGPSVVYCLLGEDFEVLLEPVACDFRADLAMLRCPSALAGSSFLSLTEQPLARRASFRARGYPAFNDGEPFVITGEITDVRGDASSTALQLLIHQGMQISWDGISGSAIQIGDRVAGVITQMTSGAATGWAASAEAVQRLKRIHESDDLRTACCDLLLRFYPDPAQLVDLRADLSWTSEGSGHRTLDATRLVDRAAIEGADGLLRLLDAISDDHPGRGEVESLRQRVLARVRRGAKTGVPSRAQQAREILQALRQPGTAGVAVLEPEGFQARAVIDEVLAQIEQPGEVLLPVRFVPERRTTSEERLYGRLLRDLRDAVPESWRGFIDAQKDPSARDRFEYAVEDLLRKPVQEAGRELLLVVEGLARVPPEQLEEWGFLLARLSKWGLKMLVWGGQELHDLRNQRPQNVNSSAFHVLREARIGGLSPEEVQRLLEVHGGDGAAAAAVYAETGGHPALVTELLERHAEEACTGDRDAIAARILDGAHLGRLRQLVDGDPVLQTVLRAFIAVEEGKPIPRRRKPGETRLEWLGVLKDAGAKNWAWAAPVMRQFAEEWS